MKKYLSIILCTVIFVTAASFSVSAVDTGAELEYIIDGERCVVQFENGELSADRMAFIAERLLDLNDGLVQTYASDCGASNHNLISEIVHIIYHKDRAAEPRCLRKTYEVTYCTNCGSYYEEEYMFKMYIPCCPAD